MRKLILAFALGVAVSFAINSFATMPDGRTGREMSKFVADTSGDTCIRILLVN